MLFANIIGNEKNKAVLSNISKPTHAYMFVGQTGIGKKKFAIEFAKKILCLNENSPCNNCKSCQHFDSNSNSDFTMIKPDGNSIKIEQIREIIKKVYEKPTNSLRKVYIIDDAEKMTIPAQNCLLKVLEEPPSFVTFILIGKSEDEFLSTIKSRCLKINFEKLTNEELKKVLIEQLDIQNINEKYFELYDGSVEKALNINGKEEKYIEIENAIKNIDTIDELEILNVSKIIYEDKEDILNVLEYIQIILYEKSKENLKYLKSIERINDIINKIAVNCNLEILIDSLLLNIKEEIN